MTKKIFILGMGRSGTTAIYSILQKILSHQFDGGIDYVYEPFLWDRSVFNKLYTEITDEFNNVSSFSVDAVYNHKKIPLFIDKSNVNDYCENSFLHGLTEADADNGVLLAKYIRANGRFHLLKKLAPDAKFIFILRNPLDVINSSINMFSFYGDDLFQSDLTRFSDQVKNIWGDDVGYDDVREVRECQYWYYMNRFLVDAYIDNSKNILPIVYENFIENREMELQRVCDFLNLSFNSNYVAQSTRSIGPRNSCSNLTRQGYQGILPYLELYKELVQGLGQDIDIDKIKNKYYGRKFAVSSHSFYDGKTVFYLKNEIMKNKMLPLQKKITKIKERLKKYGSYKNPV